jgi:hypothetical protein
MASVANAVSTSAPASAATHLHRIASLPQSKN